MGPLPLWLHRADATLPALILPERRLSYAQARAASGRSGLVVLPGDAASIASGLLAAGLGGGTAFPVPPGLATSDHERLLALAASAATPSLALIIATSGSTGRAKGVRLPWRAVAAAARISATTLALRPGDVWLACLPLHHIGGAMIAYRCWRAGATPLIHSNFAVETVLRDLTDYRSSHISLVPPMLARLVDTAERPPASLRYALVGGAALAKPLFDRAVALGWPICPTYGMTETCAQVSVNLCPGGDWQEGAVAAPLPGVRVRVTAGGRLAVATPARMAGYLGQANAGDWFETSDLGRVAASGGIHVAGRADDMLITAGTNVHPQEVESQLGACPGVREVAVTGLKDATWGDVVAAAYEGSASEDAVDRWCRKHLVSTRRPRRLLRVDQLPRTASGKLDRRALITLFPS